MSANVQTTENIGHGGEGGIRTHDEITPILVFETSALVRSAISPSTDNRVYQWFEDN